MKIAPVCVCVLGLAVAATAGERRLIIADASRLNESRHTRVEAELALAAMILASKDELQREGHASDLEVDRARVRFNDLRSLKRAIQLHGELLSQLAVENGHNSESYKSNQTSVSRRIAKQIRESTGRALALNAEKVFLANLLERLEIASDGSDGCRREIQLTRAKLRIVETRIANERAQRNFDASFELAIGVVEFGVDSSPCDRQVITEAQLAAAIQANWMLRRDDAQAKGLFFKRDVLRKYCRLIQHLDEKQLGRVGDAIRLTQKIDLLTEQIDALTAQCRDTRAWFEDIRAGNLSRIADLRPANPYTTTYVSEWQPVSRVRLRRLQQLADEDPIAKRECERLQLMLAVQEASSRLRTHSLSRAAHPVSVPTPPTQREAFYSQLAALSESQVALESWRLKNLRVLHGDGHATWKEVAIAERNLAIARALLTSAHESAGIARLRWSRESEDVARVR